MRQWLIFERTSLFDNREIVAKCMRDICVLCCLYSSVLLNALKTNFGKNGKVKAEKYMRNARVSCCLPGSVLLNKQSIWFFQMEICGEKHA